jgi:hypothetical protein
MEAGKVEISAHKRRATQCGENATPSWRLPRQRLTDNGTKMKGFHAFFRQAACNRTDKVSIGIEAQYLKSCEPPLAETRSIVLDCAFLRTAHDYPIYFQ